MQIVELGDCSMIIMKDSDDAPWFSVGKIYREAERYHRVIVVEKRFDDEPRIKYDVEQASSEAIYSAGRLVLFFQDQVNPGFHLHDKVHLRTENAALRRKRK